MFFATRNQVIKIWHKTKQILENNNIDTTNLIDNLKVDVYSTKNQFTVLTYECGKFEKFENIIKNADSNYIIHFSLENRTLY